MANSPQAKKRARQAQVRRLRNVVRSSALKTAAKKVRTAVENKDIEQARLLLREAEAQIARAKGKGTIRKRTASRRVSRLAKLVSQASQATQ